MEETLATLPPFEEEIDVQQLLPPHSIEAEQSVLGGLLIANHRFDDVADLIRVEDFYQKKLYQKSFAKSF